jgi:hypothetical protein
MFVLCTASVPPPESPKPRKSLGDNIKRMKRQMESKRLDQIKKIQESTKKIADEEIKYIKTFIPKELFDEDWED